MASSSFREKMGVGKEYAAAATSSVAGQMRNLNQGLGNMGKVGRIIQIGAAESIGIHYGGSLLDPMKAKSEGFLGIRQSRKDVYGTRWQAGAGEWGQRGGGNRVTNPYNLSGRKALSMGWKTAYKSIGLLSTAYMMGSGYQEEGIWGAAKGLGESALYSIGFRGVAALVGGPATLAAAGALTIGAGVYAWGETARTNRNSLTQLEFGVPNMGSVMNANALTLRQRSLMALQNTHLNARMSLGNEATILHSTIR